jgi:hypothetical protein
MSQKFSRGSHPILLAVCLAAGALLSARTGASSALTDPAGRQASGAFDRWFTPETMRVDYYHTGGPGGETLALDRVVSDGAWAGSTTRLVDDTGLGPYRFLVVDPASGQVLYSRGFASLYGEWATTSEARTMNRTYHESVRFPWPQAPVRVDLQTRDAQNRFVPLASFEIDPATRGVDRSEPAGRGTVWTLFENGPPQQKVDLILLGVGYTAAEMEAFHADARRLIEVLFSLEPYRSRRSDFNVRAIDLPAPSSGVSRPHAGKYRRDPVGTTYSVFDSERYALALDNRALREVLAAAPYECVGILINEAQYGGGGIFGWQAAAAVGSAFSDYIFVHEFGHHFAALADEYYTSPVAYETGAVDLAEPWEPNITAMQDPSALKWGDLVAPGTPLPTPWEKERYETFARGILTRRLKLIEDQASEAEFDRLFTEQREVEQEMLGGMAWSGRVGAFEGAGYEAVGLFRPEVDCIMFTRDMTGFCRVCQRAIERMIDLYSRP